MPRLVTSTIQTGLGVEGKMFWLRPTSDVATTAPSEFKEMGLPAGTHGARRRPSWATYSVLGKTRMYGVGAWSANVLMDENFRFMRQSIPAPTSPPSISASGTGITGECIPYTRFKDSLGNRVGPISEGGQSVSLTNDGRSWSGIPATCPDPNVDTVEGLVSMDGATPRVAWTRDLGVTTVTENVATLALGEASEDFTEMPYGTINAVFHDRQLISGNILDPTAVALSALGFMERFEGLKFHTDGENVNSLFAAGSGEIVFYGSKDRIYRLTGYTEADFAREVERSDMGTINHAGVVMVHKRLIVPTTIGFQLYDGSWHNITKDRLSEFIEEYQTWRYDYENAFGFYDPQRNVYEFGPVRHTRLRNRFGTDAWTSWVLDCHDLFPESGGDFGAAWANDCRMRQIKSKAAFFLPGSAQPLIVSGGEDGYLRQENVFDNDDDDDDVDRKRLIIEPGSMMPDTGGVDTDGFTFYRAWSYIESQIKSWIAEFRAGSEQARYRLEADMEDETAATGSGFAEPVAREPHVLEGLAGDALNYGVVVEKAIGVRFRGFGGTYGPGIGGRFTRGADARGLGPGQVVDLALDPDGGPWNPNRDECGNPIGSEVAGPVMWPVNADAAGLAAVVGYKLEWSEPKLAELLDTTLKPLDMKLGIVDLASSRKIFAAGQGDGSRCYPYLLKRDIDDPDLVVPVLLDVDGFVVDAFTTAPSLLGFDVDDDGNEELVIAVDGGETNVFIKVGIVEADEDRVIFDGEVDNLDFMGLLGKTSSEIYFCDKGGSSTATLTIRPRGNGNWGSPVVVTLGASGTKSVRGAATMTVDSDERACFLINLVIPFSNTRETWLVNLDSLDAPTAERMLTDDSANTTVVDARTLVAYGGTVYWLQRIESVSDRIVLMRRDDAAWGAGAGEEVFDFTAELSLDPTLAKCAMAVQSNGTLNVVAVVDSDVFILQPGNDDDPSESWDIVTSFELGPMDPTMAIGA